MVGKRKHSSCTLKDKLEVLKRLDKGESGTKLAVEFGVGKATISDWKKNRSKIEQFCATTSEKTLEERHTSKVSQFDKIDEALFIWFSQERQRGTPLSGPLIQEKAVHLNKLMNGDPKFIASNGWLDRWKKRHGIRQLSITGESLSANHQVAQEYIAEFADIVSSQNYSPQEIYNCDETGLNFKALPNKSLAAKQELNAPGFKMCKERVTVLACSNAAGTNKLPLMVIGKSKNPRAFKNINVNSLPVFYRHQKKAWMTSALFKEWFHVQFIPSVKKFSEKNGLPPRALLVIDNAPSHASTEELVNGDIKAIFLPPNVTPLLQPMDQEVLQNMKCVYKKMLLRSLIENEDSSQTILQSLKKINIKDVIYWLGEAWDNLKEQLLRKSWKKLWPSLSYIDSPEQADDRTEVLQLMHQIPGCEEADETDVNEWVAADTEDHQVLTDTEIVSLIRQDFDEDSDVMDEADDSEHLISHSEAAKALEISLQYVEQHANATAADIMFMRRWWNIASSARFTSLRQQRITDFVQPVNK